MKQFLVLYLMPHDDIGQWMKTDESVRKKAEEEMKQAWDAWVLAHKDIFVETGGAGQAMKVTKGSSGPSRNDIMLYSLVRGESKESVAKIFEDHPHFGVPTAWIEVMECNVLPQ